MTQKSENLIKNACYSKQMIIFANRITSVLCWCRNLRLMALRSFPNRYLFSLYSKVTSLFSIRYILEIILSCNLHHFIVWNMANYFILYYQLCQHHLLTLKQLPPFPRLTTPLPLRRTIGRCSWSLRNEESKGLGVRLYFPYTILHFIINHVTLTIVSSRNCVGIALLFQWMNFAI